MESFAFVWSGRLTQNIFIRQYHQCKSYGVLAEGWQDLTAFSISQNWALQEVIYVYIYAIIPFTNAHHVSYQR